MNETQSQRAILRMELSFDKDKINLMLDDSINTREGVNLVLGAGLRLAMDLGYIDGTEKTIEELFDKVKNCESEK